MTGDPRSVESVVAAARVQDPSIEAAPAAVLAQWLEREAAEHPELDAVDLARKCVAAHPEADASWVNQLARAAVSVRQ